MRCRFVVQLISAALWAGQVAAVEIKSATFLGSYTWVEATDWFGGFSAIHLSDDGSYVTLLSDRATLVTARITRDGDAISGVEVQNRRPLLSSMGRKLSGRAGDSEGIALAPGGGFFVSFEGVHRVAYYSSSEANALVMPRPHAFSTLNRNGSFEGLAIDGQGHLYTLPEKTRTASGDIPVFRWNGTTWSTPFTLPPRDRFLPVAADFGPDGRFYVLERSVAFIGFRTRLRRWDVSNDSPRAEEVLLETETGTHDNLEGLSVWRDDQNRLRATMISDDNFLALQRTELVEYLLPD